MQLALSDNLKSSLNTLYAILIDKVKYKVVFTVIITLGILCTLGLTLFSNQNAYAIKDFDLPDYGDRSELTLTPDDQQTIGQAYLRQLYAMDNRIGDAELLAYINDLGNRIGQNTELAGQLSFYLLEDNAINAFAVPGGHITFYSGLIKATDNESELASVVAHEIAHITQKHLPRLIAKVQQQQIPATAAIIASILVGGDVGLAGATLTNAQVLSNQLRYSRGFEREADAIGIRLLEEAGFDPSGMPGFFGKLERQARIQQDLFLEFLQTHPLSFTRIAESRARAEKIGANKDVESSKRYLFMKTKLKSLFARDLEHAKILFEKQIKDDISTEQDKVLASYALSYIYAKLRDFDKAHESLAYALDKEPDAIPVQIAKANIYFQEENYEEVIDLMNALIEKHPNALYLNNYLIETYLLANNGELAKQRARFLIRRYDNNIIYYDYLKRANQILKNYTQAAQAHAEVLAILGYYEEAIKRLTTALSRLDEDERYYRSSIKARISQLKKAKLQRDK